MDFRHTTVGIWGLGVVGKATARFLADKAARIVLYDDNSSLKIDSPYLQAPSLSAFFDSVDLIIPSPGIDTRPYRSVYKGKWLCELDIFSYYCKKPTIAITGSIGKTTVTHLLTQLLQGQGIRALAGGNIGTPMLSLIEEQEKSDIIILELSSFQLEYSHSFAPTIGLLTNLHPNHLDRHQTIENYFDAKYRLFAYQQTNQYALVPYALKDMILKQHPASVLRYFSPSCIDNAGETVFCYDKMHHEFHCHGTSKKVDSNFFPSITYPSNWLAIWAIHDLLNIPCTLSSVTALEHRLEKVDTIKGITFINDSKSTTPTSTLSAIEQFTDKKVLIMLGGLSKGIDRTAMIQQIAGKNIQTICFGKEADYLAHLCRAYEIKTAAYQTLQEAFTAALMQPDYEYLLFSPSGSSYDLFKDYIERGNAFKKLVFSYRS